MTLWNTAMVALIAAAVMVLPLAWVLLNRVVAAQRALALARARLDELAAAVEADTTSTGHDRSSAGTR